MSYKMKSASLIVKDIEKSRRFYESVFGVPSVDIGGEVAICTEPESTLFLRSAEDFKKDTDAEYGISGGVVIALFADDFEKFLQRLEEQDIACVHTVKEQKNGQRVVHFYDPDGHILEIVEDLVQTADRLVKSGLSVEDAAKRLDINVNGLKALIKD